MPDKATLRSLARELLDEPDSTDYAAILRAWPPLQSAGTVLTYMPLPHEPDLTGLPGVRLATTRTPQLPDRRLTLHWLTAETPLERHPFGYLQPVADAPGPDPAEIGLVLVPGLAFDESGGRLGHGAGYYDRLLMELPHAVLMGVARLILPDLPMEPHDVRMTHLLTRDGVMTARVP